MYLATEDIDLEGSGNAIRNYLQCKEGAGVLEVIAGPSQRIYLTDEIQTAWFHHADVHRRFVICLSRYLEQYVCSIPPKAAWNCPEKGEKMISEGKYQPNTDVPSVHSLCILIWGGKQNKKHYESFFWKQHFFTTSLMFCKVLDLWCILRYPTWGQRELELFPDSHPTCKPPVSADGEFLRMKKKN